MNTGSYFTVWCINVLLVLSDILGTVISSTLGNILVSSLYLTFYSFFLGQYEITKKVSHAPQVENMIATICILCIDLKLLDFSYISKTKILKKKKIRFFYPIPPKRGVLKKWKFWKLVGEPKLQNMICSTIKIRPAYKI